MAGIAEVWHTRARLLRYAVVTVGAVVVAFLALDDITTDRSASFPAERTALAVCAVWFGLVAWRLVHEGHRIVGGFSFVWLALAAVVQPVVGREISPTQFASLATAGTLAWFIVVAGILARWAWRPANRHAA